ncbi:MAG: SDR family NAD(P)-dependent oxidoreductase [Spirochaetales bacterium]|nr:SDR family NAD(P)-dependent oxidoreductase [Spirochaetales bacterium]
MNPKTVIITGANSGIGKQAALQLLEKECHVILGCRNLNKGQALLNEIHGRNGKCSAELIQVDMSSQKSVQDFAEKVRKNHDRIDVLIHNAAIFNVTQKSRELTSEGIETVWATNHIGPVFLTSLLLDLLRKSECGRILTVSSKGLLVMPGLKVDLRDPEFSKRKFSIVKAYYQSKLAQIIYTLYLAEKEKSSGITANCIRVPAVQIDISRHSELSGFMKWVYSVKAKNSLTPQQAAETYVDLALSPRFRNISGKYFNENSVQVGTGKYAADPKNIMSVMALTESYIHRI